MHYLYELFRFIENLNYANALNVRNCVNSKRNCAHYMYGLSEYAKNLNPMNYVSNEKLCTLDVRIVWICKKFVYTELRKFNGKLRTLYV